MWCSVRAQYLRRKHARTLHTQAALKLKEEEQKQKEEEKRLEKIAKLTERLRTESGRTPSKQHVEKMMLIEDAKKAAEKAARLKDQEAKVCVVYLHTI